MSCPLQPCGGCVELAKLDATKPTSQNFLDLIHKRRDIISTINMWHDRLTSRIPVEIISRIFVFLASVNEPGDQEIMSKSERKNWDHLLLTPMVLSRVCRTWRDIVLATPQLWTKIYFDVCTLARKLELFEEFLSRSGSLPLSLMMWGDGTTEEDLVSTPLDPIADLIRSYSPRWQFLDVEYAPAGFAYKLLHKLDYIPPSVLQGLRIDYLALQQPIILRKPLRPRHLCILGLGIHDMAKIPLEWYNVTHLEMAYLEINTLLHIVKQMPRLVKWLSDWVAPLPLNSENPLYPLPTTPIIIPTLQHLALTFTDNGTVLFSRMTLPALTHLECNFNNIQESVVDLQFDDVINFLTRSRLDSKSLQTFDLQYKIFGAGFDPRFMELTALTHLAVRIVSQGDTIIDSYLSRMSSNISVLPRLRIFHIQTPSMLSSSWPLLCDILRENLLPAGYETRGPSEESILVTTERTSLPRQFHKRPLEHLSVHLYGCICTSVPHEEYLFLRDILKAGVVKLEFKDHHAGQDILQKMAQVFPDDSDL